MEVRLGISGLDLYKFECPQLYDMNYRPHLESSAPVGFHIELRKIAEVSKDRLSRILSGGQ